MVSSPREAKMNSQKLFPFIKMAEKYEGVSFTLNLPDRILKIKLVKILQEFAASGTEAAVYGPQIVDIAHHEYPNMFIP